MEDYHVAEYRKIKNHELGLFAIFDGHLGDRVPSYLKDNLFVNILHEVSFFFFRLLDLDMDVDLVYDRDEHRGKKGKKKIIKKQYGCVQLFWD